jgi:superfamily II DNA or RNA helicase
MSVYYTIGRNGKKFYFNNGKRISEQEGIRLNATRRNVNERNRSRRPLKPCKPNQYRHPITNRCRNRPLQNVVLTPSNSPVRRGNCVDRSKMKLKGIQKKVVRHMDNHRSLLVIHGTGCGKTLTAITASQCYLDSYPRRSVVFVGPASLIANFKKEMKNYGVRNPEKYELYSYDAVLNKTRNNRPLRLNNKMLIVDEVHNMRNIKGRRAKEIMRIAFESQKCLLLTATPFVNIIQDFMPLINMLHGRMIIGTKRQLEDGEVEQSIPNNELTNDNMNTIRTLLRGKIDYVACTDGPDFPRRIEHNMDVPMTMDYYRRYERLIDGEDIFGMMFRNPRRFLNGFRRAVNVAGGEYFSRKIEVSIPIIRRGKCVIYTNWLQYGVVPITSVLKDENISYRVFSGSVNKKDREKIITDFNNNQFDTLIITKAGGEGLDLKGVRSIIVMEPPWNDAGLQQVVGRAIRYKSHAHLPPRERKVDVYFMKLTHPDGMRTPEALMSGDVRLYQLIGQKRNKNNVIKQLLQQISI